jgi:hypothetical protein
MTSIQRWLLTAFAGIIALSVGILCWRVSLTANALTAAANDTDRTVNALTGPCTDFHGDYECPVLTQLSQTEKNLGILEARGVKQEQELGDVMASAAGAITSASGDVHSATVDLHGAATALTGTANAATGTLTEATATIGTAKTTIAGFQPVLEGAATAESNINAYIQGDMMQNTIPSIAKHLDAGIVTGDAIAADAHVWSHPFLNPDPCQNAKCRFGRYVWPVIRTGLGLGSDVNGWRLAAGEPLKVKTQ